MRSVLPMTVLAVLAAMLAACGDTAPLAPVGDDPGGDTMAGPHGAWVLVEAEPAIAVPDPARVTLTVDEDPAGALRAGGTAACNSYGATLVADADGAWSLADVAHTEMGCEPALMAAESAYLDALVAIDAWERTSDGTLRLTGPDVLLRFELLPEVEPADLTGTTWELDGFVHGSGDDGAVSSTTAGVEPAVLRLDDAGTFTLFTGCRDFAGEWLAHGDEVVLPSWGVTEDSRGVGAGGELTCGAAAETQERDVLAVMEGSVRPTVDGQRLTLQGGGDAGLTFRAAEEPAE